MDVLRKKFTERLKKAAKRVDVNQADIARSLKVAPNTVNRWFSGERWPQSHDICAIAGVLHIEPWELFFEAPKEDAQVMAFLKSQIKTHEDPRIQKAAEMLASMDDHFINTITGAIEDAYLAQEQLKKESN